MKVSEIRKYFPHPWKRKLIVRNTFFERKVSRKTAIPEALQNSSIQHIFPKKNL
ncbi:hypothetical protein C723_3201 [Christiangramia flava JLT2011]|uniref:Uncharacterized protein n=1 Tax=Christiangramia flava JLT2011 TaxID=1229726 RepID=A0A1L7I7A9_9FLAO|nr:hypothetical protein GRFL_2752 [Christiangramia flava JLT2011]OSS37922.1 hypothetical protein C723_3201 [Christiangramia flava JLT2011]